MKHNIFLMIAVLSLLVFLIVGTCWFRAFGKPDTWYAAQFADGNNASGTQRKVTIVQVTLGHMLGYQRSVS